MSQHPPLVSVVVCFGLLFLLSIGSAAGVVYYLPDRVGVGLVFMFCLLFLLVAIPYVGLATGKLDSAEWFQAYVRILAHVPLLRPMVRPAYRQVEMSGLERALTAVAEGRVQVQDWKQLHHDYQTLGLRLVMLRGLLPDPRVQDVEVHWGEISDSIALLLNPFGTCPGDVGQRFADHCKGRGWLKNLQAAAKGIEVILSECGSDEDLRARGFELGAGVHQLDLLSNKVLYFVDWGLRTAIGELDRRIEFARIVLRESTEVPASGE